MALTLSLRPRALRPCLGWLIGCGQVRLESSEVATNQYVPVIPMYLKKRRSFLVKDRRRLGLAQQILRRKRDRSIERENIWTIPNILCVGRIIVCPYLGYLIVMEDYGYACCLLGIAGVTDFLDGFIARNFNQTSKIGSFLDPLADKVLVTTVFTTLTYNGIMPLWLTSIIVARDVVLIAAAFRIRYLSLPPPKTLKRYFDASLVTAKLSPTMVSKFNTVVQLGTICCTLAAPVFGFLDHPYLLYLWWTTGATTVLSAGSYIFLSNTYMMLKDAAAKGSRVS